MSMLNGRRRKKLVIFVMPVIPFVIAVTPVPVSAGRPT